MLSDDLEELDGVGWWEEGSRGRGYMYVALAAQSCPTVCDPMDCRPPGSSVQGILQVRILEWVAISSSRGSSRPRDGTHVSCIDRQILYH